MKKLAVVIIALLAVLVATSAFAAGSKLPKGKTIMVVVTETHITHWVPDPAAETEIIKTLVDHGYIVVDQEQFGINLYNDIARKLNEGDDDGALKLAMKAGAKVLIKGQAFSEWAGREESGMISCRARVETRAVQTADAKILAAADAVAGAIDMTEDIAGKLALKKAGQDVAEQYLGLREPNLPPPPNGDSRPIILIGTFTNRTNQWGSELPDLMRDYMTTAAYKTGKVRVVERSQLEQLTDEQKRGISGQVDNQTAASIGKLLGAGYVIIGSISQYHQDEGAVIKVPGLPVGVGSSSAKVAMDLRIVSTETAEVAGVASVDSTKTGVALGGGMLGDIFTLGGKKDTSALGRATRDCVDKAISKILEDVCIMACPSCGKQISASAKTCPYCGAKIECNQIWVCPECGYVGKPGEVYCPNHDKQVKLVSQKETKRN